MTTTRELIAKAIEAMSQEDAAFMAKDHDAALEAKGRKEAFIEALAVHEGIPVAEAENRVLSAS